MGKQIENKISKAGLVTIDINKLVPKGSFLNIDLSDWLDGGVIKEVFFRKKLDLFDIGPFEGAYVYINCSRNAIIPPWAYLLIQAKLRNFAKEVFFCEKQTMMIILFERELNMISKTEYKDKRVFLKGCYNDEIPLFYFSACFNLIKNEVKSLFFGEPCSPILLIKN